MIGWRIITRAAALPLALLSLQVAAAGLEIKDGYVREMPPGQTVSAAFMTLHNSTEAPIVLVAASSDAADQAEIHGHRHSAEGMRMEKMERLEVPAGGDQALQPGGYHLMLIGLKRPLNEGDKVGITLRDETGKAYSATLPVARMMGAGAPMPGGPMHTH